MGKKKVIFCDKSLSMGWSSMELVSSLSWPQSRQIRWESLNFSSFSIFRLSVFCFCFYQNYPRCLCSRILSTEIKILPCAQIKQSITAAQASFYLPRKLIPKVWKPSKYFSNFWQLSTFFHPWLFFILEDFTRYFKGKPFHFSYKFKCLCYYWTNTFYT